MEQLVQKFATRFENVKNLYFGLSGRSYLKHTALKLKFLSDQPGKPG
jgi:hypothetical protein